MGVILGKGPHPGKAGGHSGFLVAVEPTEVRKAQREITVGPFLRRVNEGMSGTIHRLDPELPLFDVCEEHIFLEMVIVPGLAP